MVCCCSSRVWSMLCAASSRCRQQWPGEPPMCLKTAASRGVVIVTDKQDIRVGCLKDLEEGAWARARVRSFSRGSARRSVRSGSTARGSKTSPLIPSCGAESKAWRPAPPGTRARSRQGSSRHPARRGGSSDLALCRSCNVGLLVKLAILHDGEQLVRILQDLHVGQRISVHQ